MILKIQTIKIFVSVFTERHRQSKWKDVSGPSNFCELSAERLRHILWKGKNDQLEAKSPEIKPKPEVEKPQGAKLGLNHHMFPTVKARWIIT